MAFLKKMLFSSKTSKMKRRKFIQTTTLASALPLVACASTKTARMKQPTEAKELYELRTYELCFRINSKTLLDYLKNVLHPTLERIGVTRMMLFSELGQSLPPMNWWAESTL